MVYRVLVAAVPVLIAYGVLVDAGIHFAYREGPASAGTVSFSAGGPEYCHVLTIDMTASRNGWAVGRLAW